MSSVLPRQNPLGRHGFLRKKNGYRYCVTCVLHEKTIRVHLPYRKQHFICYNSIVYDIMYDVSCGIADSVSCTEGQYFQMLRSSKSAKTVGLSPVRYAFSLSSLMFCRLITRRVRILVHCICPPPPPLPLPLPLPHFSLPLPHFSWMPPPPLLA